MKKFKCLICEKDLIMDDHELIMDGGFVKISFHFGSRHDQCKGFHREGKVDSHQEMLLQSDEIEAYICDDCFTRKAILCRGFRVETTKVREENKY